MFPVDSIEDCCWIGLDEGSPVSCCCFDSERVDRFGEEEEKEEVASVIFLAVS